MELSPSQAIALSIEAHQRLTDQIKTLTDEQAQQPSLLPDWTVGHVLTHLARNADGHTVRLAGALRGEEVKRYPGGGPQRDADIEAGATRPAEELIADVERSNRELEDMWRQCQEAGWPNAHLMAGDYWGITASPVRRLREVEIHHMDLGLGYSAEQWSSEYTAWELAQCLANLPARLDAGQARQMVMWLTGRRKTLDVQLGDW